DGRGRCQAGRALQCRSAAPWSCARDLPEDAEQHIGRGDVRIVAGVDLERLPPLAPGALEKLAKNVVRPRAPAIDVAARRRRLGSELQPRLEGLDRLRLAA